MSPHTHTAVISNQALINSSFAPKSVRSYYRSKTEFNPFVSISSVLNRMGTARSFLMQTEVILLQIRSLQKIFTFVLINSQ